MATKHQVESEIVESGDIFFFYRPKVQNQRVGRKRDVQRFFMVLHPEKKRKYRLAVIGRKSLPKIKKGGDRAWGAIIKVAKSATELRTQLGGESYTTKTRGKRIVESARAAGEGRYAIVKHGDHTHLAYRLELPEETGMVQKAFDIEPQGSFILSIKNPDSPTPEGQGLNPDPQAVFPEKLRKVFRGRKFTPAFPRDFLDYEGTEILLIGSRGNPEADLGIEIDTEKEDEKSAEIFRVLKIRAEEFPVASLFRDAWA